MTKRPTNPTPTIPRPRPATTRRPLLGQLANEQHDGTRAHVSRPTENLAISRADRQPRRVAPLHVLLANLRAVVRRGDRAAAALLTALIARVTGTTARTVTA